MKCACCGRKKKIFESFEELDKNLNICVDCSKSLYKYQDAVKDKKAEEANSILEEIKAKKNDAAFTEWFAKFQKRIGVKEDKQ